MLDLKIYLLQNKEMEGRVERVERAGTENLITRDYGKHFNPVVCVFNWWIGNE